MIRKIINLSGMKNYILLSAFFIFAMIGVFFLFAQKDKKLNKELEQKSHPAIIQESVLETQTNSEGSVEIKITPKLSSEIVFEMTLDTHSGELSDDMTQAVILKNENGKEYQPLFWEGDAPGDHHREGRLIFAPIVPIPKTIQIIVREIGGIAERKFLWITRS